MDFSSIDKTKLTDIQRRNLAAWRLKQYEIKQQYGDKVQIVNSLDDILNMRTPLTIPMGAIDTDKQVSILLEELREDPDGSISLVHERGDMPMANTISDITRELERQVELWEQVDRAKTNRKRKSAEFQVPKGYKLVKIEDEPETAQVPAEVSRAADILTGAVEDTTSLGTAVDVKSAAAETKPEMTKSEAMKALLDLIMQ